jgi:tripartite-type tricarboxylate transporter receptor subunit TctC
VHIPYKGSGPAMTDVIGGRCAYMFAGISAAQPHTVSGKLRALAVSTAKRSAALPETPTIAESGLPGYHMNTWNSLVVPRGTPAPIVQRLNAEVVGILNEPEVKDRLKQQGIDPDPGTPAQLAAHIKSEVARFASLIKAIGLKPE